MNKGRMILCRPENGLNDMFVEIEKCCRYAEIFDRIVIVDTNYLNSPYFKDDLSNYFISTDDRLVLDAKIICDDQTGLIDTYLKSNDLNVYPNFMADKIDSYHIEWDCAQNRFVEMCARMPISFDFEQNYSEDLLVHDDVTGGHISIFAMGRMRLNDKVKDAFESRMSKVKEGYIAIHIRNTDYKTDYKSQLLELKSEIENQDCRNLFVATDNKICLDYCRVIFSHMNVFSFSKLPKDIGVPMHHYGINGNGGNIDIYNNNVDAILDLLMLAFSTKLFALKTTNGWCSGFSHLACNLRDNPTILKHLMNRPEYS